MGAILTQTAYGPMLCAARDPFMTIALTANGAYSPEQFSGWLPYLKHGDIVIEVGSHIGAHTMAFAAAVGPSGGVLAFEPQWMPFAMCCGSLALNGMDWVRVERKAVGASNGITYCPNHDFSHAGNFGHTRMGSVGEPVPLVKLDSCNIVKCAFLKIDVEGWELDVLSGAERTVQICRPVIAVEAEKPADEQKLVAWLKKNGYSVRRFRPPYGPQWPQMASFDLLALPHGKAWQENPHLGEPL